MVDLNAHEAGNGGKKPREAYSSPSLLYSENACLSRRRPRVRVPSLPPYLCSSCSHGELSSQVFGMSRTRSKRKPDHPWPRPTWDLRASHKKLVPKNERAKRK
jgi:hypothetical protein